jgi:hypothetical protein
LKIEILRGNKLKNKHIIIDIAGSAFWFGKCFALVNIIYLKINNMAKYSEKAGEKVEETMHEMKEGKLKSGRSGKKVTNRKQAIAIGLSEARKEGAKVPKKKD